MQKVKKPQISKKWLRQDHCKNFLKSPDDFDFERDPIHFGLSMEQEFQRVVETSRWIYNQRLELETRIKDG